MKAGELLAQPKGWRLHVDNQRQALHAVLDEVGWADALIDRETPQGVNLIDRHLRADVDSEHRIPVLVLDADRHKMLELDKGEMKGL